LIVGSGDLADSIKQSLHAADQAGRLFMPGTLTGQELADAYAAIDVFAFSSQSETQGMVLAEAMAAGVPAVALDAPGAREIVTDENGRLLPPDASVEAFARAVGDIANDRTALRRKSAAARRTAEAFSIENCAERMLSVYDGLLRDYAQGRASDPTPWDRLLGRLEIEWKLFVEKTAALRAAAKETDATQLRLE
jgi:glycosyltransferase involved in cell wall biosynthesis